MKYLIILIPLVLCSCQSVTYKKYDTKGTLREDYRREGIPDWSKGKQFSFEYHNV